MNKKIIASVIMLTCLLFMPISAKADYPTGDLGYSDDIVAGNEYKWTVSKLDMEGDLATYTDYVTVGGEVLTEGATLKVVVTEDPDTAVGDWYELYLDDTLLPDSSFGYLLYYGMYYTYGGFFINPVTYTNATGTYNLYEQLLEEFAEINVDYGDSYTYEYGGVTFEYEYSEKIDFSIVNDVFVVHMYMMESMTMKGGGYDLSQHMEMLIETTININTGLIGKIEYMADISLAFYTYGLDGSMHVLIDSGYGATPYSWAFSFLGLTVIAAVVALVKRKRK